MRRVASERHYYGRGPVAEANKSRVICEGRKAAAKRRQSPGLRALAMLRTFGHHDGGASD